MEAMKEEEKVMDVVETVEVAEEVADAVGPLVAAAEE